MTSKNSVPGRAEAHIYQEPTGAASIRGALDVFEPRAEETVKSRLGELDGRVVGSRVREALLGSAPDPTAVFAELAAELVRGASSASSKGSLS